ncbi:MarR family transcriptional regulator [Streptomyces sp. AK08-02]|uniref:MarR family winged helix-turn-helix transcriptional regulator n=1 Tax=Streptomyces sp. AK08-02 TaxID=3028654 RepID=UPI0029B017FF|nr:MarR family transcriptional regulator [Streptomyces sp. AK08-02]MDX3749002.1 MarR family transcriptional regulator [Streptomyces sp. AK08-02]
MAGRPAPLSPEAPAPAEREVAEAERDVAEIDRNLNRIAHLAYHARQHGRLRELAGVPLDRAAVVLLRQLADSEPLRPGELANLLAVEASHVTRQLQHLRKSGYVTRVPDPDDRRAQLVRLTVEGAEAVARIREVKCRTMRMSLTGWSSQDLRRLTGFVDRLVDDLLAAIEADDGREAAEAHRTLDPM